MAAGTVLKIVYGMDVEDMDDDYVLLRMHSSKNDNSGHWKATKVCWTWQEPLLSLTSREAAARHESS